MSLPYDQLAAIRLGFGLSPRLVGPADPAAVAASVAGAAPGVDIVAMDRVREMQLELRHLLLISREGGEDEAKAYRSYRRQMNDRYVGAIVDRFARIMDDPSGFGERLVAFWSSHFAVRGGAPHANLMTAALVDEAIRPHLTGRFADMLFAAETHPAMLVYLDQVRSVGPNSVVAKRNSDKAMGLNENLAREMIELHSLGIGADYTQQDVEALARLLTGLTYTARQPEVFRPGRAEPGADIVMGRSYGNGNRASLDDIRDVIEDLASHEATARHIARKLAVHFIADNPPQSAVDRLTGVFRDTGGDLGAINLAVAEAPELSTHYRQKLRQPHEFLAASLRSLGLTGDDLRGFSRKQVQQTLLNPMAVMGQPWARPNGPDGWPEEAEAWGTPQGLAMRISWAMRQPSRLVQQLPDPREFLAAALGEAASEPLRWAVPRAESRSQGIGLVLASADFNRR